MDVQFHRVARCEDVHEGRARVVFAGTRKIALVVLEGQYHAVSNFCPHAGASLGHGRLQGEWLICPRHDWAFSVRNGYCRTDPRYEVRTYEVRVEHGEIWVGLPEEEPIF